MSTKSEHTPGPWEALLDPSRDPRARAALVVTSHETTAVDCTRSGKTYAEDCANARLIAAAPELLAAAERALRLLEMHGSGKMANLPAADDLRAAIAKARGNV